MIPAYLYAEYRAAFNHLYEYMPRRPPPSFYEFLDHHDYELLDNWPLPHAYDLDPGAAETVGDFAMADLIHNFLPDGFVDVPLDGPFWVIAEEDGDEPPFSPATSDDGEYADPA